MAAARDKTEDPAMKQYILNGWVSPLTSVKKFKQEWKSILSDADLRPERNSEDFEKLQEEMNISPETFAELHKVCGYQTLDTPIAIGHDLKSITLSQALKMNTSNLTTLNMRGKSAMSKARRKSEINPKIQHEVEQHVASTNHEVKNRSFRSEVVLLVGVFHPTKKQMIMDREILVLSSQPLVELRKKILCLGDSSFSGEFSNNPNMVNQEDSVAKDLYPSGFFYIDGTFYNDMSHPNCHDYSKVIMDWAKERDRGMGPFTSKDMSKYTFEDITFRLGHPYLYCHQGNCEHVILFRDMRYMNIDDCQDRNQYPYVISKRRWVSLRCQICTLYTARWVTKNDKESLTTPSFYCEACFRAFHYDEDNVKKRDFQAYVYIDQGVFS